ncbi:MAG: O-antigen ligase family protein [Oscillospiraceae bacterium]|nr:O-antigen ligase family protein [Oscillospiraceae bacterium]
MQKMKNGLWLTLLFASQPLLDVLAYWTQNERATPAGYIRLAVMLLLPLVLFVKTERKREFSLFLLVTGLFCLMHVMNCLRVGYISPVFDIRYLASVVQMPLYAVCFILAIRNDKHRDAAIHGFEAAAGLTLLFFVLAWLTGTGNVTYGEGLGYSGWVIDDNRNANSTNFVIYASLCVWLALNSRKRGLWLPVSLLIPAIFIWNGTKGCYFSVFVIFLGYALFLVLESRLKKQTLNRMAVLCFVLVAVFSALVYPWTPRCKVTQSQQQTAVGHQGEIEATLMEQGIDIKDMSVQERFENPQVKAVFEHYYWKYLGVKPDLIDRFGMDRVLLQYQMSTNVAKLIDARVMERNYADMIFQDADLLTRLVGFEASEVGFDGVYDMENDWHAIFYYYGYLGFTIYLGFILFFIYRIVKTARRAFLRSFTVENFALLLCLVLVIGLAHFSGATLRRPNVSIWLSLLLALIYYNTEVNADEAECHYSCL